MGRFPWEAGTSSAPTSCPGRSRSQVPRGRPEASLPPLEGLRAVASCTWAVASASLLSDGMIRCKPGGQAGGTLGRPRPSPAGVTWTVLGSRPDGEGPAPRPRPGRLCLSCGDPPARALPARGGGAGSPLPERHARGVFARLRLRAGFAIFLRIRSSEALHTALPQLGRPASPSAHHGPRGCAGPWHGWGPGGRGTPPPGPSLREPPLSPQPVGGHRSSRRGAIHASPRPAAPPAHSLRAPLTRRSMGCWS